MNKYSNQSLTSIATALQEYGRWAAVCTASAMALPTALAQTVDTKPLEEIVVSGSRSEQRRFDVPAAIDAVQVDPFRATSPLVNMSELLSAVPGLQIRDRQNYAQDLQISVRGFGTRSTFGVRGVRLIVDGIPATMPDGQGQAATASLSSAKRIEVLRGPVAQLYGNSAGGVLQVFTNDPPTKPEDSYFGTSAGVGSNGQNQLGLSAGGGTETLGGVIDLTRYSTDGYRDHSAAQRTQLNAKVVARPSSDTKITGVLNIFDQPTAQDPLGLTRPAFNANPRQVDPAAITYDTRKKISQQQAGVVVEHQLSSSDTLNARLYTGGRKVTQFQAIAGPIAPGVVDLDRIYGGVGLNWVHKTMANGLPLNWTVGVEADTLRETRRGFVNTTGVSSTLKRNEDDTARNLDFFAQTDWTFSPQWQALAGVRISRVRFAFDDHPILPASNNSGRTDYSNTSPVVGLVWHAAETFNLYANLGTGFETPTLSESANRANFTGPNLALQPSKSVQGEIGVKARFDRHAIDFAIFDARSKNEIVPDPTTTKSIFQNVDQVQRRGAEISVKSAWGRVNTRVGYTYLDARFNNSFVNSKGTVNAGNLLPGVPQHSLFTDIEYRPTAPVSLGLEMRVESKAYVNDLNNDAAPGYAVFNLRTGYEFGTAQAKMFLFGRIDNLLDKKYAGSIIVNDAKDRFIEPAAGRRLFVGLRTRF